MITKLKTISFSIMALLILGITGITITNPIIPNNSSIIQARNIHHRHYYRKHRRHNDYFYAHHYIKTRYYQRIIYTRAISKIKYYQKWYHYWAKKNHHNDKLLYPIFYKNTPREKKLYRLDYYYSNRESHCENNKLTWSDIKYAVYKYPINHKSARKIIWSLYKYGIGKHNNNLTDYLSFCHMYHIRPAYDAHQWHKQLIYFTYEE